MSDSREDVEIAAGRHLSFRRRGRWEFVERRHSRGAVAIVAVNCQGKLLLVEQERPAVGASVLELPAGLIGDAEEFEHESYFEAAKRELCEETGYAAEEFELLFEAPANAGLSAEIIAFVRAVDPVRIGPGGGDASESIVVHEVLLADVDEFCARRAKEGTWIDPKIFAALYRTGLGSRATLGKLRFDVSPGPRRQDSPIGRSLDDALLAEIDLALPPLIGQGRVGILGGSFDPPHVGHALLAQALMATEPLDQIWVIPVAEHPFGKVAVDFDHRLAMCRQAFARHRESVQILDVERVLPRPSFTVQTLSAFHAVRPGIEPHLIIGSDIVAELPRWREPERLAALAQIIVVPRQGAPQIEVPRDLPVRVYDGFRLPKVSSTEIKAKLGCGASVEGLLDRAVLDYLRQEELYDTGSSLAPNSV